MQSYLLVEAGAEDAVVIAESYQLFQVDESVAQQAHFHFLLRFFRGRKGTLGLCRGCC